MVLGRAMAPAVSAEVCPHPCVSPGGMSRCVLRGGAGRAAPTWKRLGAPSPASLGERPEGLSRRSHGLPVGWPLLTPTLPPCRNSPPVVLSPYFQKELEVLIFLRSLRLL